MTRPPFNWFGRFFHKLRGHNDLSIRTKNPRSAQDAPSGGQGRTCAGKIVLQIQVAWCQESGASGRQCERRPSCESAAPGRALLIQGRGTPGTALAVSTILFTTKPCRLAIVSPPSSARRGGVLAGQPGPLTTRCPPLTRYQQYVAPTKPPCRMKLPVVCWLRMPSTFWNWLWMAFTSEMATPARPTTR